MDEESIQFPIEGTVSHHVVSFSGGVGSWAAAKRVAERFGTENLSLLFTDTKTEHADTYRFLREAAANIGGTLVEIADGRTIWEVFRDERFLGNSRIDPCSKILKRQLADRWIKAHFQPEDTALYIGIDWTEEHRYHRYAERKKPWRCFAPMCGPPYMMRPQMHSWAEEEGLRQQELYVLGASHANCGGGCVKMGQGGFARLLRAQPDTFREWEENEQSLRDLLGNVSILKETRDGVARPLTLRELRERVQAGEQLDLFAIGGCGCFLEDDEELG